MPVQLRIAVISRHFICLNEEIRAKQAERHFASFTKYKYLALVNYGEEVAALRCMLKL